MRFVKFEYSAGCCGTDAVEYGKFSDDTTEGEIDEIALELVQNHCESYGVDIEQEEEESGVEWEYDYAWNYVEEKDVEPELLTDYTN
jgi:hypothetical protein